MSDNRAMIDMLLAGQTPGAFGTGSPAEAAQQPSGMANLFQGAYGALGGLAKRAFGASEDMRAGGAYNPAPAVEAAMLPMGTGAVAGVPVRGAEAVLGAGPIRAYHGSPHDFDRFDLSKIGTGEGAQAYGHGLYFAEKEATAKAYREALAGKDTLAGYNTQLKALSKEMEQYQTGQYGKYSDPRGYELKRQYDAVMDARAADKGKMYEVNINADPAHFLDWDKPLSQQPAIVQDMARNADLSHLDPNNRTRRQIEMWREGKLPNPESEPSGNVLHSALTDYGMNSPKNAALTNKFSEAGIPGIKYLDQGSRGVPVVGNGRVQAAGPGKFNIVDDFGVQAGPFPTLAEAQQYLDPSKNMTSNYVVFNDQLIDILKKYGLAGAAAPLAAAPFQHQGGPVATGFRS